MVGCELRDNDEWTLSILTNPEVLRVLNHSHSAKQLFRSGYNSQHIVWTAEDEDGDYYVAMFNTYSQESKMQVLLKQLGLRGKYLVRDLWACKNLCETDEYLKEVVPPHGTMLFKLTKKI
jgi:hypothetical protein